MSGDSAITVGFRAARPALVLASLVFAAGCRQKMADQPALRPLQASEFFEDGRASRPLVEGTVARGHLHEDTAVATGKSGGQFIEAVPMSVTRRTLERGHERYDIFCSPCHDRLGTGAGMVVQRGYPRPPSLHIDRLRDARVGYLYDVIASGFGRMPNYASQVPPEDRWAIVVYLRALQLSRHAKAADTPPSDRTALDAAGNGR